MATSIERAPNTVLQKATPIGFKKVRANSINRKEAPQIKPATEYMATQGFLELIN
jgi:hypothetical protein